MEPNTNLSAENYNFNSLMDFFDEFDKIKQLPNALSTVNVDSQLGGIELNLEEYESEEIDRYLWAKTKDNKTLESNLILSKVSGGELVVLPHHLAFGVISLYSPIGEKLIATYFMLPIINMPQENFPSEVKEMYFRTIEGSKLFFAGYSIK